MREIYCCNCFFDRVLNLIEKEELAENSFIRILQDEFDEENFVIIFLGGQIVLNCNNFVKFIRCEYRKKDIFLKERCVADYVLCSDKKDDGKRIEICIVCLLDLIRKNNSLIHFSIDKEVKEKK